LKKYCNSSLSNCSIADIPQDHPLKAIADNLGEVVAAAYESLDFSKACEATFTLIRACNKLIDEQAPWALYKQGQQQAVEQIMYTVLESVRLAAYLLSPIIPNISTDIYQQLGFLIDFN